MFNKSTKHLSLYKSCVVELDPDTQMVLLCLESEGTVGLVIGVHGLLPQQMTIDQSQILDIATHDAFLMLEVGQDIPTSTSTVHQIPIATVLESKSGQVEIKRTADGWSLAISEVVCQDQYSKSRVGDTTDDNTSQDC